MTFALAENSVPTPLMPYQIGERVVRRPVPDAAAFQQLRSMGGVGGPHGGDVMQGADDEGEAKGIGAGQHDGNYGSDGSVGEHGVGDLDESRDVGTADIVDAPVLRA